ncbi:MAG TPA: hypothetical protein VFK89_08085 [Actinomycetota bacterium]|nr:hypothetical protein [Actinomycetota bacterium]
MKRAVKLLLVSSVLLGSLGLAGPAHACPTGENPYDPQSGVRGVTYYVQHCIVP